uniref:Uncharacterized protein n=1 Tax=Nelumbo nucifera TaxID=4432 RepID=A0A822YS76_NELNU|nr:TPA_asm: hypothetical protein HUJ06_012756 [Nelumbo nucifera]
MSDFFCYACGCTGSGCQRIYPGLKVEWPELLGQNAHYAVGVIQRENPRVTVIIMDNHHLSFDVCCNRVKVFVNNPDDPQAKVLYVPMVG